MDSAMTDWTPSRMAESAVARFGRLTLAEVREVSSEGSTASRWVVRHPGAAVIFARDGEEVIFLRQYRTALDAWIMELPAGTLEIGEAPLPAAKREFEEETGLVARDWTSLGFLYPAPGFCDEVQHLFLAEGLEEGRVGREATEHMTVERIRFDELDAAILDGTINDGKSIAMIARYRSFLQQSGAVD